MEIKRQAPRTHESTHEILSMYGRLPDDGLKVTILAKDAEGRIFISFEANEARELRDEINRILERQASRNQQDSEKRPYVDLESSENWCWLDAHAKEG